jgi:hypothetical protein
MARRAVSLTKNRPTAVLVIAILHFVFGGLGLVGAICGGAGMIIMSNIQMPTAPGQPKVPTMLLSIVYATLSILTTLATFYVNFFFVMPVMSDVFDQTMQEGAMGQMGAQQQQAMRQMMRSIFNLSYYTNFVTPLVQMIYPITVLVIMYLPHVRAAFRDVPRVTPIEAAPDETDQFEARER